MLSDPNVESITQKFSDPIYDENGKEYRKGMFVASVKDPKYGRVKVVVADFSEWEGYGEEWMEDNFGN